MKHFISAFLRGLALVLPVGLTLYFFYFLFVTAESLVGGALLQMMPGDWYWTGMGFAIAIVGTTVLGLLAVVPGTRWLVGLINRLFASLPVVKTVYSTLRDFMQFVSESNAASGRGHPVSVEIMDGVKVVGLTTNANSSVVDADNDCALVYLPMSFQLGGYTISVPKEKLEPLDMTIDEAMRFIVTAGVKRDPE